MWRGCASVAMGISALAVRCRGELGACATGERGCEEAGRPIAMGRAGVALRKSNGRAAIAGRATASMVVAGREPAQQKCSTGMSHRT